MSAGVLRRRGLRLSDLTLSLVPGNEAIQSYVHAAAQQFITTHAHAHGNHPFERRDCAHTAHQREGGHYVYCISIYQETYLSIAVMI